MSAARGTLSPSDATTGIVVQTEGASDRVLVPLAPLGDGAAYEADHDAAGESVGSGPYGARDTSGRFLPGNRAGRGNPHAAKVARLREALLAEVTPDDLRAAVRALVQQARAGDVAAIRELLDRTCGKTTTPVAIEGDGFNVGDRILIVPPPVRARINDEQ